MLSLVFAETALELVPKKLSNHPSIISHAKRLGKNPKEILLDKSWHFAAMHGIKNNMKRARPDLVHICLQNACSTPLYIENRVKVYVHTINDQVIFVGDNVHLPKTYHRFARLIEKLFLEGSIKHKEKTLLSIKPMNFSELLSTINPSNVIGFTVGGKSQKIVQFSNLHNLIQERFDKNTCIVIGGFQKCEFSSNIRDEISEFYQLGNISLEAHVITSRVLYEYEKQF